MRQSQQLNGEVEKSASGVVLTLVGEDEAMLRD